MFAHQVTPPASLAFSRRPCAYIVNHVIASITAGIDITFRMCTGALYASNTSRALVITHPSMNAAVRIY